MKKKKTLSLTAVIEKEGKWYVATCPELGAEIAQGTSRSIIGLSGLDAAVFKK